MHIPILDDAHTIIENHSPELVFLSLSYPKKELERFLAAYSPYSRLFGMVFMEDSHKQLQTVRSNLRQQTQRANFVAEHQAGYLYVGGFGNETLRRAVNTARTWLRHRMAMVRKEEVVQSVETFLKHPYIVAHGRILQEHNDKAEDTFSRYELHHTLRYTINRDEEYQIPCDRIVRVQGEDKYCRIWYFDEAGKFLNVYLPKKPIMEQLQESIFVQTHRSHWVNVAYIRTFTEETIILLTDEQIPCARRERLRVEEILRTTTPQLFSMLLLQSSFPDSTVRLGGGAEPNGNEFKRHYSSSLLMKSNADTV